MRFQYALSALLAAVALGLGGCGLLQHVAYVAGGSMIPPQFKGLEDSRVAVVCVSDATSYGSGTESERLARGVAKILQEKVPDIEIVSWSEIADWIDRKGWDEIDYREVGRGVKADRVVAVDLSGFRLHEGASLFKGRADVTITVFDMTAGGKEVFQKELVDFGFPTNGPYHAAEISESRFSKLFLTVLAREIAKNFHEYDIVEDFGSPSPF